jgi:hypothetical protein
MIFASANYLLHYEYIPFYMLIRQYKNMHCLLKIINGFDII